MNVLEPIVTVRELKAYLDICPDNARLRLMTEDGENDGFPIGGILQFAGVDGVPEVWIMIDEFSEVGDEQSINWASGVDEQDMLEAKQEEAIPAPEVCEVEKPDIVKVRGKLRSA